MSPVESEQSQDPALVQYARRLCESFPHLIEDVWQASALGVADAERAISRHGGHGSFGREIIAKRAMLGEVVRECLQRVERECDADEVACEPEAEGHVHVNELIELMCKRLSDRESDALALHADGWSATEIGGMLGVTRQGAAWLVKQAADKMRRALR